MTRTLAGMLAASLLLAGCAGIPVTMDPASMGRAYVRIQHDTDGAKSTCHVEAAGGMEAKGVQIDASLCSKDGDKIGGKADDLSGKDAQAAELDKWAALSAQQQQTAIRLADDALKAGGPIACAAVLTAVGFPAATPFCAALAGIVAPVPPVVRPSAFAPDAALIRDTPSPAASPFLAPGLYLGPRGYRRELVGLEGERGDLVRYRSLGNDRSKVATVREWLAWVVRPLPPT